MNTMTDLEAALKQNQVAAPTTNPQPNESPTTSGTVELSQNLRCVLVKFTVKDPNLIPADIHQRIRQNDQKVDEHHAQVAHLSNQPQLAQVGRVREGRVDTGRQVVNNLQLVQLGMLRKGLSSNSFFLADSYCYAKTTRPDGAPATQAKMVYVIVLVFKRGEAPTTALSSATIGALRELASTTWQFCHVWDNTNPTFTVTVNLGGPQKNGTPKHAIVVRHRKLVAVAINNPVGEEEE